MPEKWDHSKLQPGDPVAYTWSPNPSAEPIVLRASVQKVTMTHLVLDNGTKFHRETGRSVPMGRGQLIDPAGEQAQAYFWWSLYFETQEAIDGLEPQRPVAREDFESWLDAVSVVVQESRARLREIGGES